MNWTPIKAYIGVFLLLVINLTLIYVIFLYFENMGFNLVSMAGNVKASKVCGCLSVVSDTPKKLTLINNKCEEVEGLRVNNGEEWIQANETLNYGDYIVINHTFKQLSYQLQYNTCQESISSM